MQVVMSGIQFASEKVLIIISGLIARPSASLHKGTVAWRHSETLKEIDDESYMVENEKE